MADRAERIARLQAQGVLTEAQAQRLLRALTPADRGKSSEPRRGRGSGPPVALSLIAVTLLVAAFLIFAPSGDQVLSSQDVAVTLNTQGGTTVMSRNTGIALLLILILSGVIVWLLLVYNSLVAKEEQVHAGWAQVESNYQRRADLIPNLVSAVSRYLGYESETLKAVTEQRAASQGDLQQRLDALIAAQERASDLLRKGAGGVPEQEERLAELERLQQQVGRHMKGILAVVENYPQLEASEQMLELQAQLEGTENRINVARMRFNEAAGRYNAAIRRFPGSLVAALNGFRRKAYFQSKEGADEAVSVQWQK